MKTTLTFLTLILSFFLTSCYTQFATVREDEGYVVKRERYYKEYEERDDTVEAYEDEADEVYAEEEAYYEEDDNVRVVEYHYSSRPYVYLYRFTHYDPWYDEYVYYNRPVTVISVRLAPRWSYYDPYWAGFYCSPYDYCDPWFGWCGYGYASYYPYYYGHYYYDYYYGGYYHGYYGRRGYRYDHYRYGRDYYASNWGRRPFTSSRAGRLAARPERPDRPDAISRPERPLDMPDSRPVVSRPDRQKQEPLTLERPVRNSNETLRTQPTGYKNRVLDNDDRKYQKKYYNSSERIKKELANSRDEVKPATRKRLPESMANNENKSKTEKRTYKYNSDRREQRKVVAPRETKNSDKPSSERSNTTTKRYSGERSSKSNTISKPKSSSRESSPSKSYVKPRSSDSKSYTPKVSSTPRSSSRSSSTPRSTVRSAPSRSSSSGGSRSSGGSSRSSSGSSKSSGGKRPR